MTKFSRCPHYSILLNPKTLDARSDARAAIKRAHEAVIYLASLDADKAMIANGQGFAKSDVTKGHNLARWPTAYVVLNPFLAALSVKLARKYRRQLPPRLQVDQPEPARLNL